MHTTTTHAAEIAAVHVAAVASFASAAEVPAAPVSQVSACRLSSIDAYEAGNDEIHWLYSDKSKSDDAATVQARETIEGWLSALPSFHRGAIALHFERRPVPESLKEHIGSYFAFVLRMECAARPSDGTKTVAELEAAAVARMELALLLDGPNAIKRLHDRAERHHDSAMNAYTKVRGRVPCVLPAKRAATIPTATA
jgi:hypothetical protein